jgi:hypothetical protein
MRLQPIAFVVLLAAVSVAAVAAPPPHSGFLESYPALKADPKHPGGYIYVAPGFSLKGYSKLELAPITIWYAKDSPYQGIDPEELSGVTKNLRAAMVRNLEPDYPVLEVPGKDVLQLRIAITQVVAEKKKRGILGYTPIGFVVGAAKDMATAGPNVNLKSATLEAELLDPSGKQLAVSVDPLVPSDFNKDTMTWADLGQIMDAAGKRMRARLDGDNAH